MKGERKAGPVYACKDCGRVGRWRMKWIDQKNGFYIGVYLCTVCQEKGGNE